MLKNLIYISLISILLISCEFKTAEDYYYLAYELERQGKYKEAIIYLDKAIKKKPNLKPALLNRGADKSELNDFNGAIKDYKLILKYDSDNTLALMNIGNNYKRLKNYKKAVEFYTKALNSKGAIKSDKVYFDFNFPNEWDKESDYYVRKYEIEFERGISHIYLKEYIKGIKDLKDVIKYNYEVSDALSWTGQAYYEMNDTLNAIKFLSQAANYGMIDAKELLKKIDVKK
jgi:tetratricopeptide (TPR) repeat protein